MPELHRQGQNGETTKTYSIDHPIFQREAENLFCRVPVSMTAAALGGEIEAPLIDGGRSRVKVPAGCMPGARFRVSVGGKLHTVRVPQGARPGTMLTVLL